MAFPVIQTADTKFGTQTSNSTSWTLTYPTNIAAGDLLLCFVATDGATANPTISGWFRIANGSNTANELSVFAKIAAGTETGTFTFTGDAEQGAWRVFRITGWFGGSISGADTDSLSVLTVVTGSPSATPDPPSVDPGSWATEDTLWFAACSVDTSRTISVYPLAGNNTADVSGGSTGATLGICTTTSTVGSLNPGTFTISASDDWVASTVAIRPGVVVPTRTSTGTQPASSATLTRGVKASARTATGAQPAASSTLSFLKNPVQVDAVSSSGGAGAVTLPHTCSGTNRLLLLFVADWTGGDASGLTVNPQYNGVAMSLHGTHAFSTARVEVWSLVNPASGSHNLTYTNSGAEAVIGISLNGVDQTAPLPSVVSAVNGPNPPVTGPLTVGARDMWVEGLCILCGSSPTPGAGFTQQASVAPCNPKALVATSPGTGGSMSDTWVTALADGRWASLALRVAAVPVVVTATVAGAQPASSGALTELHQAARTLTGAQPSATATLSSITQPTRTLTGSQPAASGLLARLKSAPRSLTGVQPFSAATLGRLKSATRGLVGVAPAASGTLTRTLQAVRALTGSAPAASGTLSALRTVLRILSGTQPAASGLLARVKGSLRPLAGSQPASSATLARFQSAARLLAGVQPAASGLLARLQHALRALTSSQPAASASLTRVLPALRTSTGAQPAASGSVTRQFISVRVATGASPPASGTLVRLAAHPRALSGTQPAAPGALNRQLAGARNLTGSAPAALATLTRLVVRARSLAGQTPAASGALVRQFLRSRSLSGTAPPPSGELAFGAGLVTLAISVTRLRGKFDLAARLAGKFDLETRLAGKFDLETRLGGAYAKISTLVGTFDPLTRLRGTWGRMMAVRNQHDTVWTGDDHGILVTIEHPSTGGELVPEAAVYAVREDLGGPVLFQKTLGAGVTVADPAEWVLRVDLASEDTEALVETASYHHGLQLTQSGRTSQVFDGLLTIHKSAAGEGA